MAGERNYSPYVIIGKLTRDFILTPEGDAVSDIPGGHLLYTAIGMSPWEKHPGLVSKVGKSYPEEFLELLKKNEFSLYGIKRLDFEIEQRNFISYFESESTKKNQDNKSLLSQYFHAGKPFPKELLGYNNFTVSNPITAKTHETFLVRDIPREYLEARCVHLCPMDYLSHNLLPQAFPGLERRTITIHASNLYMQPHFYDPVKTLVNGLSGFFTREKQLKSLFYEKYRFKDISDMMKILLDYGSENIIVKMDDLSYKFINRFERKIFHLDPGSDRKREVLGSYSSFCGGFIIGLNTTYDYKKAAAYGAARESLMRNEWKPYNNLNVYEDLLNEKVRIMESKITAE